MRRIKFSRTARWTLLHKGTIQLACKTETMAALFFQILPIIPDSPCLFLLMLNILPYSTYHCTYWSNPKLHNCTHTNCQQQKLVSCCACVNGSRSSVTSHPPSDSEKKAVSCWQGAPGLNSTAILCVFSFQVSRVSPVFAANVAFDLRSAPWHPGVVTPPHTHTHTQQA